MGENHRQGRDGAQRIERIEPLTPRAGGARGRFSVSTVFRFSPIPAGEGVSTSFRRKPFGNFHDANSDQYTGNYLCNLLSVPCGKCLNMAFDLPTHALKLA